MEELKKIFSRVVAIFTITFLPCAGLLMVYFFTAPKIAEYADIKEKRAVLDVFKIPYRTEEKKLFGFTFKTYDKKDIQDVFQKNITVAESSEPSLDMQPVDIKVDEKLQEKRDKKIFKYVKNGNLQGIGFVETKLGYGYNKSSTMSLFICLEPDLETLKGIEVLDHGETPGLGGRIVEEQFKGQFTGKRVKPRIIAVKGRKAEGSNEFDAITGATNTSRGIEAFINDAVNEFLEGQGEIKW